MTRSPRLILASRSPRRIELLREAGYAFEIEPADVDESDVPAGLTPESLAGFLATAKARLVAGRHPDACVLGADTVVAIGGATYGKADSHEEARAMLEALAGRRQDVWTGVTVIASGHPPITAVERAVVEMKPMSSAQLDAYLASEQWRGKAGAYGIQDHDPDNDPFVWLIDGTMTNVVGLPMSRVQSMLGEFGIEPKRRMERA